ncbi:unnamed protein product, partial [Laminaria digitata]
MRKHNNPATAESSTSTPTTTTPTQEATTAPAAAAGAAVTAAATASAAAASATAVVAAAGATAAAPVAPAKAKAALASSCSNSVSTHEKHLLLQGSPKRGNISPPTAAPSHGSYSKVEPAGDSSSAWGRASTNTAGGADRRAQPSPPPPREQYSTQDDAPPELDALRPTFSKLSQAARIPSRRRLPITLAPVGVRGDETNASPLPSLFSATSSAAAAGGASGGVSSSSTTPSSSAHGLGPKPWGSSSRHQTAQPYSRQFAELALP